MPEALISRITSREPGVGSGNSLSSSFRSPRNTTPFIRSSNAWVVVLDRLRLTDYLRATRCDQQSGGLLNGDLRDANLHASRRQDGRGGQALYRARLPGAPEGRS